MVDIVGVEDSGDGSFVHSNAELLVDISELVDGDEARLVQVIHVEVVLDFSVGEGLVRGGHVWNLLFYGRLP